MAKKFVKVTGIHKVFSSAANLTGGTFISTVTAADPNSIIFFKADATDATTFSSLSVKNDGLYIWAKGRLYNGNDTTYNLESYIQGISTSDDDVVNISASKSGATATITASHAKKGVSGGAVKGATSVLSVSAGGSGEIYIPRVTADEYGHVTALTDAKLSINIPAAANTGKLNLLVAGATKAVFGADDSGNTTFNVTASDLGLGGAMHFRGKATVEITDGSTTDPKINGYDFSKAEAGDVILSSDGKSEFVWDGAKWEKFGDDDYAVKTVAYSDNTKTGTSYTAGWVIVNGVTSTVTGQYDKVSVTASTTSGDKVADVIINGTTTALYSKAYTVNDSKITISAGSGLKTGGSFTLNQSSASTITIAHQDGATDGSNKTSIGGVSGNTITVPIVSTDAYGHVSSLTSTTFTHTDKDTTYTLSGAVTATKSETSPATAVLITDTLTAGGSGSGTSTSNFAIYSPDGSIQMIATKSGDVNVVSVDYTGIATADDWDDTSLA